MIHSELDRNESLYQGVTTWAATANPRTLGFILASSLIGGAALLVLDWHRWPLAGLLVTAGSIGGWGLIEQRAARPLSPVAVAVKGVLVGLGTIAAVLGGLGLLFWLMGPAPIL